MNIVEVLEDIANSSAFEDYTYVAAANWMEIDEVLSRKAVPVIAAMITDGSFSWGARTGRAQKEYRLSLVFGDYGQRGVDGEMELTTIENMLEVAISFVSALLAHDDVKDIPSVSWATLIRSLAVNITGVVVNLDVVMMEAC